MSRTNASLTTTPVAAPRTPGRGVRRLSGPVHAHVLDLDKPRRYDGLLTFRCGDPDTEKAVAEVQQTARRLHAGSTEMTQTPVVLEDDAGELIGYCSVHRRNPREYLDNALPYIADRYIVAFGRDLRFRKCLLRSNLTSVGAVLVQAGLDMIALEAERRPMPSVSALVRRENGDSHRIFESFGFKLRAGLAAGTGQECRWRARGTPPPPSLPLDVYVPPERPAPPPEPAGRNEPCTCGSGNKFKKCCGR